jgi:TonB family protein
VSIRIRFRWAFVLVALTCALSVNSAAQEQQSPPELRRARVAVLDFGNTEKGRLTADRLAASLSADARVSVLDRGQSRAAALGAGYNGSRNMTLEEARSLGAVIDCDFFVTGDAQTLPRSPSTGRDYWEAYAAVFIVSARTGKLVLWERPSFEAATPAEAEKRLFAELEGGAMRQRYGTAIRRAQEDEYIARNALLQSHGTPVIEDAPEDAAESEAQGLRLPQPYRRLRPPYPDAAASIEVEAIVDVQVEIGADGEVGRIDVVRWAGFGLEEATIQTVRQMHFRPAMRGGVAFPMRVLLRYNFRKPPKQ